MSKRRYPGFVERDNSHIGTDPLNAPMAYLNRVNDGPGIGSFDQTPPPVISIHKISNPPKPLGLTPSRTAAAFVGTRDSIKCDGSPDPTYGQPYSYAMAYSLKYAWFLSWA